MFKIAIEVTFYMLKAFKSELSLGILNVYNLNMKSVNLKTAKYVKNVKHVNNVNSDVGLQ